MKQTPLLEQLLDGLTCTVYCPACSYEQSLKRWKSSKDFWTLESNGKDGSITALVSFKCKRCKSTNEVEVPFINFREM